MNIPRIRAEIRAAVEHFPNIETFTTNDGGVYIKAALQTSVGQMYIIMITFNGYPSTMPKVTVITPAVKHGMHMYQGGHICYMHRASGTLRGMIFSMSWRRPPFG